MQYSRRSVGEAMEDFVATSAARNTIAVVSRWQNLKFVSVTIGQCATTSRVIRDKSKQMTTAERFIKSVAI